jgi:hypothetical protein
VLKHFTHRKDETEDVAAQVALVQICELVCMLGAYAAQAAYPLLASKDGQLGPALDVTDVPVTGEFRAYFPFVLKHLADLELVGLDALESWAETRKQDVLDGNELGDLFKDKKVDRFVQTLVEALQAEQEQGEEEEEEESE